MSRPDTGTLALIHFYGVGAARLAQRNALTTLAVLIVLLALHPNAVHLLRAIGLAITASDAPRAPGFLWMTVASLITQRAVPTLQLGLGGWIGSLPLSRNTHRRAISIALLVPLLPLIVAQLVFIPFAPLVLKESLSAASLVGSAIGYLAVGAAAVPVRRRVLARSLAFGAASLWISGTWTATVLSVALFFLWDRLAGPAIASARPRPRQGSADRWIALILSWRALGRRVLYPSIATLFLLSAAWLFRTNNDLSVSQAAVSTRLAMMTSLWLGLQILAEASLVLRRPWPWARSLPSTSRRRALEDLAVLGLPVVPVLLLTALLDPRSAVVGLASLPLLTGFAVLALRHAPGRLLGAIWMFSLSGGIVVAACVAWPMAALVALALTPAFVSVAARADRKNLVTGWEPLHHDAAGDSLSEVSR